MSQAMACRLNLFADVDTREVDPSCVDAHKRRENGVDVREFDPRVFERERC
jgi:hypothetical protein